MLRRRVMVLPNCAGISPAKLGAKGCGQVFPFWGAVKANGY